MSARSAAGMPRLTPQPIAPDTARFGTIRHIERRARSLKESPPMEVFGSNFGLLRTSNLRSAPRRRQRSKDRIRNGKRPTSRPDGSVRRPLESGSPAGSGAGPPALNGLVVEVQRELVRVRTQAKRVHLVL